MVEIHHVTVVDASPINKGAYGGPTARANWRKVIDDLSETFGRWQLWWLLGLNDIRQRYRRSRLGQLWITLSMAVFLFAIGPLYALLFNSNIGEFLPYLTVNIVVWGFLSSMINDGCAVFIQADNYLRQERIPKLVFVMRILVRNLLILGHNAVLIPIVFIAFQVPVSPLILLAIPGLLIVMLNSILAAVLFGTLCARFRDMPQIVANIVQVAFFITPIFWQRRQILAHYDYVVSLNPFAAHLGVISLPILNRVPTVGDYLMCLASTLVLAAVTIPFFARFRPRIAYWV
jgi:lipopolysaccharide transport system permease protein